MRQAIKHQLIKRGKELGLVGVALTAFVNNAMAALPAEATAAFGSISNAASDVLAAVWPVVGTVVAGFIMIKLFKRGTSKI